MIPSSERGRRNTDAWWSAAACADEDPDLFFPIGTRGPARAQFEEARVICLSCPVRTRCLEYAMKTGAEFGMWGGTTPDERKRIGRRAEASRTRAIRQRLGGQRLAGTAFTPVSDGPRGTLPAKERDSRDRARSRPI
ncbi:WhiB family transcriptional regulator [Paenarthrobacter aurescens]|jgi:WhiB family redox-sensing transcriptional regulator|uniref:Transcriptional regulator WhiB n=1 Tax=Paenarthrobacter aurescens (strain TC1) TaxID=290340 RepID=A1RCI6_PAEAT|nr:putative transcription factor WhiB family [Paenarthrobacter aurescens TC1]